MKNLKTIYVLCLFFAMLVSTANCSVIDELIQISHEGCQLQQKSMEEAVPKECKLFARETSLISKLFDSNKELEKVESKVEKLGSAVFERLINRARFEANHGKKELAGYVELWEKARDKVSQNSVKPEKIGRVYGVELNLSDGEWNFTADGKRFWASNQFPDIILTPTEYRSVMQTVSKE